MKTEKKNEIKLKAIGEVYQAESFMVISQDRLTCVWQITGQSDQKIPMGKFINLLKDAFIRVAEEHPEFNFKIIQDIEMEGGE
jgi:hypothetical protein